MVNNLDPDMQMREEKMAKDKRDRKRGQDLVDENMELLGSLKL